MFVASLDRADRESGRALLKGIPEEHAYEAAFSFPKGTKTHNDKMDGVVLRLARAPGNKLKPVKLDVLTKFFGGQGTINVNSWSPDSKQFAFVVFEPIR